MASFAMMLAIQTLHSPLQHLQESLSTVRADSGPPALICGRPEADCSHSHQHGHHSHAGWVSHTHTHSHADGCLASCDDFSGEECSSHSGRHSHAGHDHADHSHTACLLCQFLTQPAQPVCLPVLLTGEEMVSAPPVDLLPERVLVPLTGPYVRGPPALI